MAVPFTSLGSVVDLMPAASHETSPEETLDVAELKCPLCANEAYCSRLLEK